MIKEMTEDEVRDLAGKILKFENSDSVISGVGQLTTFNQFTCCIYFNFFSCYF